jgi:quinol monooxygenase YgiN
MHGLIGKITVKAGARDLFIRHLLSGIDGMPGCLSYIVARDPAQPDTVWVTEAWETEAHHRASLQLPGVKAAIAAAMPLIAGFETVATTEPVGGQGLPGSNGAG